MGAVSTRQETAKVRGGQDFQGAMFSYVSLEERVPAAHPLRKLRAVVDTLLATMVGEFEAVYARRGRPSVPPEEPVQNFVSEA
jgi:hypothetical protein